MVLGTGGQSQMRGWFHARPPLGAAFPALHQWTNDLQTLKNLLSDSMFFIFGPVEADQIICQFSSELCVQLIRLPGSQFTAELENQILRLRLQPPGLDGDRSPT